MDSYSREVNIFGSCVSRDAISFIEGHKVNQYVARQSIVSAVNSVPQQETIEGLVFKHDIHQFHKRCVVDDFKKNSLNNLFVRPDNELIIVDFIEERMPVATTNCGTYVTFSQVASELSNARSLINKCITPFSDQHFDLFKESIKIFAEKLVNKNFVIHKAFYSENVKDFEKENKFLNELYRVAEENFQFCKVIEVTEKFRKQSATHKWGEAPYHYVDEYYRNFVEQLSNKTETSFIVDKRFSLQKT